MPPTRLSLLLEDAFILVSVFALWPGILGWQGALWQGLQYAAVAGLVWILFRRVRRYKERREDGE
jgi:hypothetical protein